MVAPTDPAALTADDREEIAELTGLDDEGFRKAVNEYVAQPDVDGSGARVFRSAALADRTWQALIVLIAQTAEKLQQPRRSAASKRDLRTHQQRLGAERKIVGQVREAARQGSETPRQKAMRALPKLHPADFLALARAFEQGMSTEEALKAVRARESENHP